MSFTKIKAGKGRGKYSGRAGFVLTRRQAARHHMRAFDVKPTGADPTGTTMIRKSANLEITRYWQKMKSQIRKNLVADVFGLQGSGHVSAVLYGGPIKLFNAWFESYLAAFQMMASEPIKLAIVMSYNLGARQAWWTAVQRSKAGPPLPGTDSLVHAAQNELQGIVGAVLQQGNRIFAEGLFSKASPAKVSKSLAMIIDKIGVQRSGLLVGFYTVRANGHGRLDYWQSIGKTHVGIIPERISHGHSLQDAPVQLGTVRLTVPQLRRRPKASQISRATAVERRLAKLGKFVNVETAGDSRVCPICEAIAEDGPYLIDRARTLIPAHPRCRCGFTSVED